MSIGAAGDGRGAAGSQPHAEPAIGWFNWRRSYLRRTRSSARRASMHDDRTDQPSSPRWGGAAPSHPREVLTLMTTLVQKPTAIGTEYTVASTGRAPIVDVVSLNDHVTWFQRSSSATSTEMVPPMLLHSAPVLLSVVGAVA